MKLFGATDGEYFVASMGHHDCVRAGGAMADGGQPHTNCYAGYNRWAGHPVWFEVPQEFDELHEDYQFSLNKERKFGVWKKDEIKVVITDYDPKDPAEIAANSVWGTRGENGDQPLRYVLLKNCSKDHLKAIQRTQSTEGVTKEAIEYLLKAEEPEDTHTEFWKWAKERFPHWDGQESAESRMVKAAYLAGVELGERIGK